MPVSIEELRQERKVAETLLEAMTPKFCELAEAERTAVVEAFVLKVRLARYMVSQAPSEAQAFSLATVFSTVTGMLAHGFLRREDVEEAARQFGASLERLFRAYADGYFKNKVTKEN